MDTSSDEKIGSGAWRLTRTGEFLVLYVLLPVAIYYTLPPRGILPVLWVAGGMAWILLHRAEHRNGVEKSSCRPIWPVREIIWMTVRLVGVALVLTIALQAHRPRWLFSFPRTRPNLWLLVMLCYPLISVLPQGLLYRKLFERRYAVLFSSPRVSYWIGALIFGFAHLPFGNLWAIIFPFLGGLIFLRTYRRTGSLLLSGLEHGLYGDLLFTIGWGAYLFHGGTQALLAN